MSNIQIKSKIFRSSSKSIGQSSNYWKKYVLSIECISPFYKSSNYPNEVNYISGIQYIVHISTLIFNYINNINENNNKENLKEYLNQIKLNNNYENYEKDELIECISLANCYVEYDTSIGITLCRGQKTIYTPIYYCIQFNKPEALRILLDYNLNTTILPDVYSLEYTNLKKSHLYNIGGNKFIGKEKIIDTFSSNYSNNHPKNVNLSLVPNWEDIHPGWNKIDTRGLNLLKPLELAFSLQNYEIFSILLEYSIITNNIHEIKFSTNLPPFLGHYGSYPSNLVNLKNLLKLSICDPLNKQSIPNEIFTLTQLEILNLEGSGFTIFPDNISSLISLKELHISNMLFQSLPLISLSKLSKLKYLDCSGIKLASPPIEIIQRGPEVTAQYIHDLGEGAVLNHDVLLMFIGDGEAGKTSTLNSLKNKLTNKSGIIGVDDRTIGIDITEFQPDDNKPLKFFAWDFAGQGVYAIMQQLFMSKRAIYPLLWRVRQSINIKQVRGSETMKCDVCGKFLISNNNKDNNNINNNNKDNNESIYRIGGQGLCHSKCVSYDSLIMNWTERLQFRVPGVTIILIATHIDCATLNEVDEQCNAIKQVVKKILHRQELFSNSNIPKLKVYNNGESIRINNLTGEGIIELRQILCSIAESLDSYGEVIPSSYIKLRHRLRQMHDKNSLNWKTWLQWDEYVQLAQECGISNQQSVLELVTTFYHDIGELRYFGNSSDIREIPELLKTTVFPNPYWIVDVLRGLIRHDHGEILKLINNDINLTTKESKILRRRVYRLMQKGILHESLLPYIWKGVAGMYEDNNQNKDEYLRLIALLQAFDILMDKQGELKGIEWIVPCLATGKKSQTISSDSIFDDTLPFMCRLIYDSLPPFFDIILIAHIMNTGIADSVNFIDGAASFRNLSETALLYAGMGKVRDPKTVFRIDQLDEEPLSKLLHEDQRHIVISSSCRSLLIYILNEVQNLEFFFPGLRRLCTLFPCYSCRSKKQKVLNEQLPNEKQFTKAQYYEAEENDLKMKLTLPQLNDFHFSKLFAYKTMYELELDEAYKLVSEFQEFFGKFENFDPDTEFVSSFCDCRKMPTLRYQQEAILAIDKIIYAMNLKNNHQDEYQKDLENCNNNIKIIVEKMNLIYSFEKNNQKITINSLKKYILHDEYLDIAIKLSPELSNIINILNQIDNNNNNDDENQNQNEFDEDIFSDLLPILINDRFNLIDYFLRSSNNIIQKNIQNYFTQQFNPSFTPMIYDEFISKNFIDINLIFRYFPSLLHSIPPELKKTTYLFEYYQLLKNIIDSLQLNFQKMEGSEKYQIEIQEFIEIDSKLIELLSNKYLINAIKYIDNLNIFIEEICNILNIYHPKTSEKVWMRKSSTYEWSNDTFIENTAFENNLNNNEFVLNLYRPIQNIIEITSTTSIISNKEIKLNLYLTKYTNIMYQELKFFVDEINQITQHLFSKYYIECIDNLKVLGLDIKEQVQEQKQNDANNDNNNNNNNNNNDTMVIINQYKYYEEKYNSYLFIIDFIFDNNLNPLPLNSKYEYLEKLNRLYESSKIIEQLEVSNELVKKMISLNEVFETNMLQIISTNKYITDIDINITSKNITEVINYYYDVFKLILNEASELINSQIMISSRGKTIFESKSTILSDLWKHPIKEEYLLKRILTLLLSLISSIRNTNSIIDQFYILKEKMKKWELLYPITIPNPKNLSMYDLLKESTESESFIQLFCNVLYYCRLIGKRVKSIIVFSKSNNYDQEIMSDHGLRLASYLLAKKNTDILQSIIDDRMNDLQQYFDLLNQFSITEYDLEKIHEIINNYKLESNLFTDSFNLIKQNLSNIVTNSHNRINLLYNTYKNEILEIQKISQQRIYYWYDYIDLKILVIQKELSNSSFIELINKMKELKYKYLSFNESNNQEELTSQLNIVYQLIKEYINNVNILNQCELNTKKSRLNKVLDECKQRSNTFNNLMKLREEYGPPWYFGAGIPTLEDDDVDAQFEDVIWREDWDEFIISLDKISRMCPAERNTKNRIVQPDDSCSVFISHTPNNQNFAKLLNDTIQKSGICGKSICTFNCNEQSELEILSTAKTVISCIDNSYSSYKRGLKEFSYAENKNLEIIPLVLPDYKFENYQQWWPPEIPELSKHSLFIDMRGTKLTNEEYNKNMIMSLLIPTLKSVLSEWKPISNSIPPIIPNKPNKSFQRKQYSELKLEDNNTNNNNNNNNNNDNVIDRFIPCENCYLEGVRDGVYDRLYCQKLLNEWKVEELKRREQNPDEEFINICPVITYCSNIEYKHPMFVREVLSISKNRITIPCPSCIRNGILPPFSFQRELCLAEYEYSRKGSISCNRCNELIPLVNLLQSEVFISYSWGDKVCPNCSTSYWNISLLTSTSICSNCSEVINKSDIRYSTQILVTLMKQDIELDAGVTCWQDIDQLVGGSNLDEEMEIGIKQSDIVIIFLDDNYIRSNNCRKEYLYATKYSKYIIPVILVPNYKFLESNNENNNNNNNSRKWYPKYMSSLSQFEPIYFSVIEEYENILLQISERIQSRFHRVLRYPTNNDIINYISDYSTWKSLRGIFLKESYTRQIIKNLENDIKQQFKLIDINNDQYIQKEELLLFLQQQHNLLLSETEINNLINECDINCDNLISFYEFQCVITELLNNEETQNES